MTVVLDAPIVLATVLTWHAFVSASAMMALLGTVTLLVFRRAPIQSWRLRSWLVACVLLQGMMLVRSPIHLGLVDSPSPSSLSVGTVDRDAELPAASLVRRKPPLLSEGADASPALHGFAEPRNTWQQLQEIDLSAVPICIWFTVTSIVILRALHRYLRVLRLVRKLEPASPEWQREWQSLQSLRSRRGAQASCKMLVSDAVGPLMVRRPGGYSFVVPASYWRSLNDQQRRGVMLHELAHVRRHDVWRQLLARLIATVHWFNPLAWWALRQYEHAAECACDQHVLANGKRNAAGFASALVALIQWQEERRISDDLRRGLGFQSMSAPPLSLRISLLLRPRSKGEPPMKRLSLAALAFALIVVSFFQIRLTTAEEGNAEVGDGLEQLRVLGGAEAEQLDEVASRLDQEDEITKQFRALFDSSSGKIAIAGYLNALAGRSRDAARSEAIPRFIDEHFSREGGQLVPRPKSRDTLVRWTQQSKRLESDIAKMRKTTSEIAAKLDTTTEAGGLFKRLLEDPQAPVAVLIGEMKGGDVISRYLAETLDQMLVDQGNGTFRIVESKRLEAEKQVEQFERADKFSKRLARDLPLLAAEYASDDEKHQRLIRCLQDPITATVVGIELAGDSEHVSEATERLHEHFEQVSRDTPNGLVIEDDQAWEKLNEICDHVDRASGVLPRIREKLAEISETLANDDPLTARMAVQMKCEPVAVLLASKLPYAEADPGEELRALLSEIMSESNGKLVINSDRTEEVAEKARELLRACRKIRRYVGEINDMLDQVADREFVEQLGEAGRYQLLDEIRRFAEGHQPNPVALMNDDLFAQNENGKLRVRDDRQEIVRQLIVQSERVRAEASKDDF